MRICLAVLLCLAGSVACKPPKFNETIVCAGKDGFRASGVAVYDYEPARVYVLYPDRHATVLVNPKGCVVSEQ